MREKVTIRDVAERAGVSIATVSLVLNEVPGKRVSEATRQRIRSAAAELQYRPNRLAQGLRGQRSRTIGFVSDEIVTTPYAVRMILGAQEAAAAAGSLLILLSSGGDSDLEDREIAALLDRRVDGVVYASMYHRLVQPPARLRETTAVLLDGRDHAGEYSSVVPDEIGGAREAVEELLRHGHRNIAYLNNVDDIPATRGRLIGYRQALEVYGAEFDPNVVVPVWDRVDGNSRFPEIPQTLEAATELLSRKNRPTALFCFNDRVAMGAYQAAMQLGLSIPGDVSIVGFDDQDIITAHLRPGLTTARLPHYDMGRWAVETLLAAIDSNGKSAVSHAILPCPLVRRDSVAAPAVALNV